MIWVVEAEVAPGEGWQAVLLDLLERFDEAGADEVDAEEKAEAPRAFGYYESPPKLAALTGLASERVQGPVVTMLSDVRSVAVPDGFRRPFVVGPFEVRGSQTAPSTETEHSLQVVTHTAWGTGMHPTTALMMLRLAERDPGPAVLDVGTGTGILALAALARGSTRAVATDIERSALEAARANAGANGMQERLTTETRPPDGLTERFDTVLANIRAAPLLSLAAGLAARVAPSGRLYLSGLRAHESAKIVSAFEAEGLDFLDQTYAKGWLSLAFAPRDEG